MLLTLAFLLVPVATAVWSDRRMRRVRAIVAREQTFSEIDTLISKVRNMGDIIRATGVRGRHAAECLNAMTRQIAVVSECTEQFMQETRQ